MPPVAATVRYGCSIFRRRQVALEEAAVQELRRRLREHIARLYAALAVLVFTEEAAQQMIGTAPWPQPDQELEKQRAAVVLVQSQRGDARRHAGGDLFRMT